VNEALLDLINGDIAGRWDVLDDQVAWWAANGLFVLAAIAAAFGLWQLRRQPRAGLTVAMAVCLGAALAGLGILALSSLIFETRPFVTDHDTIQLLSHGADNAFPSDHATLASLVAVTAALAWRRWAPLFLVVAVLASVSRVIAGIHYPGDIAAGWALGAGAAALGWLAAQQVVARMPAKFAFR
jgi:membrane-associated phospholipid phosphatase